MLQKKGFVSGKLQFLTYQDKLQLQIFRKIGQFFIKSKWTVFHCGIHPQVSFNKKTICYEQKGCTVHYILSAVLKLIIIVLGLVLKKNLLKTWGLDTSQGDMKV